MKNDSGEYHGRTGNFLPSGMFNLLKAAYGSRAAEEIFRSYGINPPATIFRGVQKPCMAC